MRHIKKRTPPSSLSHHHARLHSTPDLTCDLYANHLTTEVRQNIVDACLQEQQGLCAYTGQPVVNGSGHIEHLIPRSVSCRAEPPRPEQTIDWRNMVVCFPAPGSPCHYGAIRKGDWPSDTEVDDFVSPLDARCERRFRYNRQGGVAPMNINDEPARKTIERLGLDHPFLNDARRRAIQNVEATLRRRNRGDAERARLLVRWEDREVFPSPQFSFQLSQVFRREWAGTV